MQYHLVFSTDSNYVPLLFVTAQSILNNIDLNRKQGDELIFNVLIDSSVNIDWVKDKTEAFSLRNKDKIAHHFKYINVDKSLFYGFSPWNREDNPDSLSSYYRLIIDQCLDKHIKHALYLDIDILVCSDIRLLMDIDLENYALGAILDAGVISNNIKLCAKESSKTDLALDCSNYFNAGVLLINLERFREEKIGKQCMELAKNYHAVCHDQDLLNFVCEGKTKILDLCWNFQTPYFFLMYSQDTDRYDCFEKGGLKLVNNDIDSVIFEGQAKHPCLIHFTYDKPWQPACYINQIDSQRGGLLFLPTLDLGYYYQQWISVAKTVIEFKDKWHFQNLDLTAFYRVAFKKCFENTQKKEKYLLKKIRKLKKLLIIFASCSFLFNLILLILIRGMR